MLSVYKRVQLSLDSSKHWRWPCKSWNLGLVKEADGRLPQHNWLPPKVISITISVSFVHSLRCKLINNSFISFLPDRVWKRFTKEVQGEWREELTFRTVPVSSTRARGLIYVDITIIILTIIMLDYYLIELYSRSKSVRRSHRGLIYVDITYASSFVGVWSRAQTFFKYVNNIFAIYSIP